LSTDTETNAEAEGRTKANAIPKRWNTASILILLIATSNGRTPTELADLSFRSIARRITLGSFPKRIGKIKPMVSVDSAQTQTNSVRARGIPMIQENGGDTPTWLVFVQLSDEINFLLFIQHYQLQERMNRFVVKIVVPNLH